MRAFAIDEFGKPGGVREAETPKPGEGEVLLRVRAAGVNAFDVAVVNGFAKDYMEHRFPLIPGLDGSGEVAALGAGVDGVVVGDEVYGIAQKPYQGAGTYAEFQTFPAAGVTAKPSSLDHVGAAALPTAALTALSAVEAVDPREGRAVLIIGATGGVGSYATQFAAKRGARVLAVARGEYTDYALSLGASESMDYTSRDLAEHVRTRLPMGSTRLSICRGTPAPWPASWTWCAPAGSSCPPRVAWTMPPSRPTACEGEASIERASIGFPISPGWSGTSNWCCRPPARIRSKRPRKHWQSKRAAMSRGRSS